MRRVTWTIEVDGDTPVEAAREALEIMRDPSSTALVFEVDGVEVDLWEETMREHGHDLYGERS